MAVSASLDCAEGMCPFTREEVIEAIEKGKSGKATGPDCIPTELLKEMMRCDSSVDAFVEFFNRILKTGDVPKSWDRSVVALLPKVQPPSQPKQLRPIALASHVSKAYARLVLQRLSAELQPQGEHQLAGKHRQAADFVWLSVRLAHLCREWKRECYLLKLDLQRAFDSVNRVKLAQKLCQWSGDVKPFETRSLVRLLASTDLVLHLPWEMHEIESNTGVKQGATESPLLFARLLDDLMGQVGLATDEMVLEDLPHDSAVFMDDVLAWKSSIKGLQHFVNKLLPLLAEFGLVVQPEKCKLLCLKGTRTTPLMVDGKELYPLPQEEVLMIMNLPLGLESTEQRILEAMVDKARGKFFGVLRILCSHAPLRARMRVLEAVVFGAVRWCLGALVPTVQAQQLLNSFQYNCVRRMMGLKRGKDELWVDFETRSLRMARAKVYQIEKIRWGDKHVLAFWRYTGHLVRESQKERPSVPGTMAKFRDLVWWNRQQGQQQGKRRHRHFPFLMNAERRIASTIGDAAWRVAACNRAQWKGFEEKWLEREQIPWASGRQSSLTM